MASSDHPDSIPGVPFDPHFKEAPWRVRPIEPKDADYLFKRPEGWVIVPDDHFDFPVGFFIATNDPRYGELFARIAAAGPELLEALKGLLAAVDGLVGSEAYHGLWVPERNRASAAIARAEATS